MYRDQVHMLSTTLHNNYLSCYVRKEGKEILVTKETQPINLVENDWHEIEAAEDGTVFINVFGEGKF